MKTRAFSIVRAFTKSADVAVQHIWFLLKLWIVGIFICIGALLVLGLLGGGVVVATGMVEKFAGCLQAGNCGLVATRALMTMQGVFTTISGILLLLGLMIFFVGLTAGYIKVLLELYDTGKSRIGRLFECFYLVPQLFFAGMLYSLIVMGGLLLLIIPGVYWLIRFQYFIYFIIEENCGAVEALRKSWRLTAGSTGYLFLYSLVVLTLNIPIGSYFFGAVGSSLLKVVVAFLTTFSIIYIYRSLQAYKRQQPVQQKIE